MNPNNTNTEAYKIFPDAAPGPYRVERVGISPYSGPFTWGVIRSPEATFIAITATKGDAERVRDALNSMRPVSPVRDPAPPDNMPTAAQVANDDAFHTAMAAVGASLRADAVERELRECEDILGALVRDVKECVRGDDQRYCETSVERAENYLEAVRGVRDPSPPEPSAGTMECPVCGVASPHYHDPQKVNEARVRLATEMSFAEIAQAIVTSAFRSHGDSFYISGHLVDKLKELLAGVRGSGVVPPEPTGFDVLSEALYDAGREKLLATMLCIDDEHIDAGPDSMPCEKCAIRAAQYLAELGKLVVPVRGVVPSAPSPEVFRPYLQHKLTCDIGKMESGPAEWPETSSWVSANLPCNCGLSELLRGLSSAAAPPDELAHRLLRDAKQLPREAQRILFENLQDLYIGDSGGVAPAGEEKP